MEQSTDSVTMFQLEAYEKKMLRIKKALNMVLRMEIRVEKKENAKTF